MANKSKNKSHFSFGDLPWKWILIGIIIFIVLLGVIQVIQAIANLGKELAQFFGGAGALGDELVNPCIQQENCDALGTDCNKCEKTSGCTCAGGKTCNKYASRDVGSGGFIQSTFPYINFNCFLGLGLISMIIGGPLLALIKLIVSAFGKKCSQLKDYLTCTGKKTEDVVKDWTKESKVTVEKTKKALEKQGVEVTKELSSIIEKISIQDVATKQSYAEANISSGSIEDRQAMINNTTLAYDDAQRQYQENISKYQAEYGGDTNIEDIINNNRENIGEKPIVV